MCVLINGITSCLGVGFGWLVSWVLEAAAPVYYCAQRMVVGFSASCWLRYGMVVRLGARCWLRYGTRFAALIPLLLWHCWSLRSTCWKQTSRCKESIVMERAWFCVRAHTSLFELTETKHTHSQSLVLLCAKMFTYPDGFHGVSNGIGHFELVKVQRNRSFGTLQFCDQL